MRRLIEFLLANPILAFVAVAWIAGILGNLAKAAKRRQQQASLPRQQPDPVATRPADPQPDADAVSSPDVDARLSSFEHEAGAVGDGPAVRVGAVIAGVAEELVGEVAVGAVQLDAVEPGSHRVATGVPVVLDDPRDFGEGQSVGRDARLHAAGGARFAARVDG